MSEYLTAITGLGREWRELLLRSSCCCVVPPVWRSGNAPGGDEANAAFIGRFRERVRWL